MAVAGQRTHAMTDAPNTIIFHCGFHKTGSTVIQETLDKTRPLAGHDVCIVGRQAMHHHEFRYLLKQLRSKAPAAARLLQRRPMMLPMSNSWHSVIPGPIRTDMTW